MTIEEKARAYDKALKWMRELYPGLHGATKEDAEHYFPELRESEDERIRRKMIEHFKSKTKETWCNMPVKDILSWLEKQKDHFRDDTKMVELQDYSSLNDLERAIHRGFLSAGVENAPVTLIKETAKECLEQMKPSEINIRALLSADRLASAEMTGRLKERSEILENPEEYGLYKTAEWDEFDKDCLKRAVWYIENPAPSVVKDTNLVLWLKSIPERFNFQPKQEWSKEDERIRKWLIDYFTNVSKSWIHRDISPNEILDYLGRQKDLFESGRGLYYYDGEKTTYCGYPATEENPYDFAMSQQEKQKEQKPVQSDDEKAYIRTIKSIISDFIRDKKPEGVAYYQRIYDWLDGRHIEQKPAEWSEEDEKIMQTMIKEGDLKQSEIAWLKSLRPQPHWRPSEEQIHAIVEALKYLPNNKDEWMILNTLVDILKKLM